jgi:hypothetical protein
MALPRRDLLLVPKLRRLGIRMPLRMLRAAHKAGIAPSLAAAMLIQESAGGMNVFGHDPTIYAGAGTVTKRKYLAYKRARGHTRMQGVGPLQLTWYSIQDEADARGGCWDPYVNMLVGFQHLSASIRRNGYSLGIKAYNGSGPAADEYSRTVRNRAAAFKRVLGR